MLFGVPILLSCSRAEDFDRKNHLKTVGARRITRRHKNSIEEEQKLEQEISEKDKSPSDYLVSNSASIYIL
jgi:hypothetical protein